MKARKLKAKIFMQHQVFSRYGKMEQFYELQDKITISGKVEELTIEGIIKGKAPVPGHFTIVFYLQYKSSISIMVHEVFSWLLFENLLVSWLNAHYSFIMGMDCKILSDKQKMYLKIQDEWSESHEWHYVSSELFRPKKWCQQLC